MSLPANRRRTGFTLVELAINLTLLTVLFGGVGLASFRAVSLFAEASLVVDLNSRGARACDRIARTLMGTSENDLTPDLTPAGPDVVWSGTIDFRRPVGFTGTDVDWGDPWRLGWERDAGEADNGVDDDGDGLIDEGQVVLTEAPGTADERRVVLVRGVAEHLEGETFDAADENGNGLVDEAGFSADLDQGTLNLRLTLQALDRAGNVVERTQEVSLCLRND